MMTLEPRDANMVENMPPGAGGPACAACGMPVWNMTAVHVRRWRGLPLEPEQLYPPSDTALQVSEYVVCSEACVPRLQSSWRSDDLAQDILKAVHGGAGLAGITHTIQAHRAKWEQEDERRG